MQTLEIDDTVVAIASAPGPAPRGIVRISGPSSGQCLANVFKPADHDSLNDITSRSRIEGKLAIDAENSLPASLLWWPDDRSYTRQPCGELHLIGSGPLLEMLLERLCEHGARLAQPGEFTMRAFLSGRIDLTQAEAVLAVIDSESESELANALQQLAGGIGDPITVVRDDLLDLLAELEAGLDFVEEDIEFISAADVERRLKAADEKIRQTIEQMQDRSISDQRLKVVLLGKPNAGKSSLFNALVDDQAAIVSDVAGTTRDFLSADVEWDGLRVRLIDTAGLGLDSSADIDQRAQQLAESEIEGAGIRLICIDSASDAEGDSRDCQSWLSDGNSLVVLTKNDLNNVDLAKVSVGLGIASESNYSEKVVGTSSVSGAGLRELKQAICNLAGIIQNAGTGGTAPALSRAADSLACASESVLKATEASIGRLGEEVIAAEVRSSLEHLGRVVGTIYTDDILDLVFGRFCIGK